MREIGSKLQEKIEANANLLKTQREIESLLRDSRAKQETAVSDMGTLQSALDRLEQQLYLLSDAYKEAKLQEELIRSQHEGEVADLQLAIRHQAEVAEQLAQQLGVRNAGTVFHERRLSSAARSASCAIVQLLRRPKRRSLPLSMVYSAHFTMNRITGSPLSFCTEGIAQEMSSAPRCAHGGNYAPTKQGMHGSLVRF